MGTLVRAQYHRNIYILKKDSKEYDCHMITSYYQENMNCFSGGAGFG